MVRVKVDKKEGTITVLVYNSPPNNALLADYAIDTHDAHVRQGLVELGWTPPKQGEDAEEIKET